MFTVPHLFTDLLWPGFCRVHIRVEQVGLQWLKVVQESFGFCPSPLLARAELVGPQHDLDDCPMSVYESALRWDADVLGALSSFFGKEVHEDHAHINLAWTQSASVDELAHLQWEREQVPPQTSFVDCCDKKSQFSCGCTGASRVHSYARQGSTCRQYTSAVLCL